MNKVAIAAFALLAIGLTGCGTENAADGAEEKSNLEGHYKVGTVYIKGHKVTCVTMEQGIGDATWGGLSCDFTGALDDRP